MSGSQKFISRNRAPRVQIEYDVELYGAEKKVQLPFVMGVLSDLSGVSEQPPVADRKFLEIDADSFDDRMRSMAPRARFTVPNTLSGEGNLAVDLTFEKMEDFSPQAIAAKIDALAPLLEARQRLSDLMAYMDGKSRAETLIETLLAAPDLLRALAGGTEDASDMDAALASLRARLPDPEPEDDGTDRTLAELAAQAPEDLARGPSADDVLSGIERRQSAPEADETSNVLARIERREDVAEEDRTGDVLAGIERRSEPVARDEAAEVLSGIERREEVAEKDRASEVLAAIDRREDLPEADRSAEILAGIERTTEDDDPDELSDVLAGIERSDDRAETGEAADILDGIERQEETEEPDSAASVLVGIPRREEAAPSDDMSDVLAGFGRGEEGGELRTGSGPPASDDTADLHDILAGLDLPADDSATEVAEHLSRAEEVTDPASEETLALDEEPAESGAATGGQELDDLLSELAGGADEASDAGDASRATGDAAGGLDDLLAGIEDDTVNEMEPGDNIADDLDALLADIDAADDGEDKADGGDARSSDTADDLEALLADLEGAGETEAPASGEPDPVADLLAEDDLGVVLTADDAAEAPGVDDPEAVEDIAPEPVQDDLDALLADLGAIELGGDDENESEPNAPPLHAGVRTDADAGLDDLLAELGTAEVGEQETPDDLDALLSDLTDEATPPQDGAGEDLEALLADMGTAELGPATAEAPQVVAEAEPSVSAPPPQAAFGTISAPQPQRESMNRSRFRMAIFGDFTGRAARGLMETGDALARREAIALDVDTVEDVTRSFATTLTLPIGKDGEGIEVKLGGLDDLHPDELYESVEIFEAISGLRQQLGVGSMAGKTTERLKAWAEEFGTPVRLPKRSAATSVPPDLKLSDFQALIGDTRGTLTRATPADDLIARIVGPHVVKGPDAGAAEMLEAVDEALSAAMRLVLHHPDFQAVESQWRSLDLLARRIETDTNLQIVLYDVSAEEMAADLSAQEDLAQSGLFRLLTEVMDPEEGEGGFSALFGLYTFEETPPHAELLARIGKVAAHVDAPFFAAISPAYLETPKEDRHRLVAEAWDTLRAEPQAAWLGLASPRFLLRQPYGAKSDPCYAFDFEEFTPKEGLKGLLWANPVVLVAILLAATWKKDGRSMNLGSVMSLGELPFTYVNDRYGDQVALPCTERNLTSDPAQETLARGYMPVLWVKGRNEIRLGSFRSLGGSEIAGPWASQPPPRSAPPAPTLEMELRADAEPTKAATSPAAPADDPLAELDSLLDTGKDAEPAGGLDLLGSGDDDGQSLDDLLASFADDADATGDDDDMDPELAALLEGL